MISDAVALLANHLWQSTLFAAAVWLIALALRENRAAVRHSLWFAASVKFLIPFSLLVGIGTQFQWLAPSRASVLVEAIGHPFGASVASFATIPIGATSSSASTNRVAGVLFCVWVFGFVVSLVWWAMRWFQLRGAVRQATPMNLDLPIRALAHQGRLEPGVFGILKPVLLFPDGIMDRLTPGQLQAVLAHELCHVRRRDNLTAAIHMFVEALFWFHPLVWWIRLRLVDEQERACDEEVLRLGGDPQVYAESILRICECYLTAPSMCVSGMTSSNLKKRIEAIMKNRVALKLSLSRALLLAVAAVASLAGPIMTGVAHVKAAGAQSEPADWAVASPIGAGGERLVSPQTAQLRGTQNAPANPTASQAGIRETPRTPGVIQDYRVGEIKVAGARVLHNDVIRSSLSFVSGDAFNESRLRWSINSLEMLYRSLGYVKFMAEPVLDFDEQQKVVNLTVNINEGRQFTVGEIKVTGAKVLHNDVIRSLLGLVSGEVYNESRLRKGFEDLMKLYGSFGYVNSIPEPVLDLDEQQKVVNLTINVDEGRQYTVNRIGFTGNTTTPSEFLRREVLVKEGEVFNASLLNLSLLRLNQLGSFEEIKEENVWIQPSPGESILDINIRVKEKGR